MFRKLVSSLTLILAAIEFINANISSSSSLCVCTSVPCPINGYNYLTTGGGAIGKYYYSTHNGYPVVTSASITITASNLDTGTDTTSCTQDYSRMLDDDGVKDCDAGHILANRLGGPGNQPINIFPQDSSINRGTWSQFEGNIYDCIKGGASSAALSWQFIYESTTHTKPNKVTYSVAYTGGSCSAISTTFNNYVTTTTTVENTIYVLAYSWTPGFCFTTDPTYPGCVDPKPYWMYNFTIHGLWPQYDTTGYPSYCSTESFDPDVPIEIGWDIMTTYYPDVKYTETSPDYDSFWEHEWDKHGTCSGLSQYNYFQQAILLAETFITPEILHKYINTTNALSSASLRDSLGGSTYAALQCSDTDILTGVYTCWSHIPVLQIECPASVQSEDTCTAEYLTIYL
jgi:ribonuclease T2